MKDMSQEELDEYLPDSELVDSFDHTNEEDTDDYVLMELRLAKDGRHFRYITSSGFNSPYVGAGNIGEWLEEGDMETWTEI